MPAFAYFLPGIEHQVPSGGNRLNVSTCEDATAQLQNFLLSRVCDNKSAADSYNRHALRRRQTGKNSILIALGAKSLLPRNGVTQQVPADPTPTPRAPAAKAIGAVMSLRPEAAMTGIDTALEMAWAAASVGAARSMAPWTPPLPYATTTNASRHK